MQLLPFPFFTRSGNAPFSQQNVRVREPNTAGTKKLNSINSNNPRLKMISIKISAGEYSGRVYFESRS